MTPAVPAAALRSWADRAGSAALSIGVVVAGYAQGRVVVTVPLPVVLGVGSLALSNAAIAWLSFTATLLVSGIVLVADLGRRRDPGAVPSSGPRVAAIVPVYGDAGVLHRSVESLLDSRYEDLHVFVVCEPGDDATVSRAEALAGHERVDCLVDDRAAGSKAAAVDYAVAATDSDYVGVFDADERVHPSFVGAAVAGLERHELVQGRTLPRPAGPVETAAYYESILLGYLTHRLLGLLTGFRMAASNVVVMRRSAFERVDGYDPGMLTEDFDFAFRCYEAGVDVREELAYPSEIEAAHTVADWWGQRKRWMTGYAQVFHRRLGALAPTRPRTVLALGICGGAILGNLFLLSLAAQAPVLAAVGGEWVLAFALLVVWGAVLTVRWLDARAGRVDGLGVGWLAVPLLLPLYSLAAIKGIVEYPISWRGEWYHVTKRG